MGSAGVKISKMKFQEIYEHMNLHAEQTIVSFCPIFYIKVMKVIVIRNFVIAKKKGKW